MQPEPPDPAGATSAEGVHVRQRLNTVLLRLQLLHATTHAMKAGVVWCILAFLIRQRMGWETVHLVTFVSFLLFFLRGIPSRRTALKRLEKIRSDSEYRFTTVWEKAESNPAGISVPWATLVSQTDERLRRPTPYLCIPGFGGSFRAFAAAVAFTLAWTMFSPPADEHRIELPAVLRVKIPAGQTRAGTDVRVRVYTEGRMAAPHLDISPLDGPSPAGGISNPAAMPLRNVSPGMHEAELSRVFYSLRLTASADVPGRGTVFSPEVVLRVVRPPTLAFVSALVVPPGYTGRKAEEVRAAGGRPSVLPGSAVTIRLESDVPVSSVDARYDSPRPMPTHTDFRQNTVEVQTTVRAAGQFRVRAVSADGLAAEPAFTYDIDTLPDRAPTVSWISPAQNSMDAPVEGVVPMRWDVEDDFGVSSMRLLVSTSAGQRDVKSVPVLPQQRQTASYLLDITSYTSFAGTEVEIVAEALDHDNIGGPNVGRSTPLTIRAPTVMDMYRRLTEQGGEVNRMMEKLSGESTRLLKKMATAARTMKAEGRMAWQMEQEIVSMAEAAQQAKKEAESALAELGRRTESASRQSLLSRETLQKLSSIGSMMNTLLKEDYMRAQQELSQAIREVHMDAKERAMTAAQFNLEQFVEQVDRTHRMLERMTDIMAKAEAEKAVNDMARRAENALSEKNADNLRALAREAAALMPKLQEMAKDPAYSELKKAMASSAKDLPDQMNQAAQAVRQNSKMSEAEAKAAVDKLKQTLDDLKKSMESGNQRSESSEKQNAAERLNTGIDLLIFALGEMQADHEYFSSGRSSTQDPVYSRHLQKSTAVEPMLRQVLIDVGLTADRLILFDPRPFQLLQRSISILRGLAEHGKEPSAIASRLKVTYRSTSTACLYLIDMVQDLQKQSGGKQKGSATQDLADLLQQLIGSQMSLNSRMQMSLQLGSLGQSLEQLAFQQELIRRSMEAEAGRFSDLQDKLGRIDQLLEDMRRVEDEIRRGGATQAVQERQQKILNKLMELQHSLTDKEEKEEKFEAEPFFGKPADTSTLRLDRPAIDETEFFRRLPAEYHEAGRKYLRSLMETDRP